MHLPTCLLGLGLSLLASCSSLPVPGGSAGKGASAAAVAVLKQSAATSGNPWRNYREVKVAYSGEWSNLATRLQPVLTDPGFRKGSVETYQPRVCRVLQLHSGPQGTKQVVRQGSKTEVLVNGTASKDSEVIAAAALVAGKLSPGIGSSAEDQFIVWIGKDSGLMRRFQFSLNGLDSTRGADVEVTFSDHWQAADGSIWPGHFVETIQRPILTKAHDWRLSGLSLDGRKVR